ncbi:hypothetical protein P154DRAFT_80641 [Amniculicola lignicola CBS 123094]|uniref:Uncharacterized protein n=1 Tax=Amniculicola lignicola CBS 123094 TaxID=1392246 RepID=A0A6A5WQC7_9PLEO|nr:hypothetical protein P154DRAFT_80641 [Amniculicola lignicola CBS 123094]
MYKQQAVIFASLHTFQVDLSFKRVSGGFHELIFAFYHEQHGKLFTLARIYINCERQRIYQKCFEILFDHISQCTSKELQNTVKFCTAHFMRSIKTATSGEDPALILVRERMRALLTCQSWEEYDTLCAQLIEHESPTIGSWAKHKRNAVIAAGLNRNITLMTQRDWNTLEETSNHVEQAAKKSYSFGKSLRLLPAILAAQLLDQRDIDQFNSRVERDIRHSHRSTSLVSRYSTEMARQNDAILFQASSSGYVRARSSSRQRFSPNTRDTAALGEQLVQESDSTSSSNPTPSKRVAIPFRSPSSQPSLQRQILHQNLNTQSQRTALELREKEAEVRRQELQNRALELDILERERALDREN